MKKRIVKRLYPVCILADCPRKGKPMDVVVYEDGTYRGGHYFGEPVPIPEQRKRILQLKGGGEEYWECPTCYWHPEKIREKVS